MEYPTFLPKWVREVYEQEILPSFDDESGPDRERVRVVSNELIQSDKAIPIWQALEKMPDREERLEDLFGMVWVAHWGFGHVEIKSSDRAKIAADVRKHCDGLLKAITRLTDQDWLAMNSITFEAVEDRVNDTIADEIEMFHRIYNDDPDSTDFVPIETIQRAKPSLRFVGTSFAHSAVWSELDGYLLDVLCAALDVWAKPKDRLVTKPDHPNARRLYFIRSLTRNLHESFGRPMRRETLALASVYFDCDGLDEAAISRIAPVRTTRKPSTMTQPE